MTRKTKINEARLKILKDLITKFPEKKWGFYDLSYYINNDSYIIVNLIEAFPDKNWNWSYISINIPKDFLYFLMDKFHNKPLNWDALSKKMPLEYINKNQDKNWNYASIYFDRKDVTLEIIIQYKHWNWDWHQITSNSDMTFEIFKNNLDIPWNIGKISSLNDIDYDFVDKHINEYTWNFHNISYKVPLELIDKYNDKPWKWFLISTRSDVSLDFIEKYIDKFEYFDRLTKNKNLTFKFINDNMNRKWDYKFLLKNGIVSLKFIMDNKLLIIDDIVSIPDFNFMEILKFQKSLPNDSLNVLSNIFKSRYVPLSYINENIDKLDIRYLIPNNFNLEQRFYERFVVFKILSKIVNKDITRFIITTFL